MEDGFSGFFEVWKGCKFLFFGCLLLMLLLFNTGCSSGEQENSGAVELKLAHFWPATHPFETDFVQPWSAAIEEATGGKVKITSYPGETLLKADAMYDGVVNGIADIGASCFSYTRGRFPVVEVFELPGITYKNSKVASKVAWEGIQQLNPDEVQDTKLMMVLTTGPGDIFAKKPVNIIEDLKGMEIRATGLSATTLEKLGAVPVAMAQSEAYEALSKGVVQGNLAPVEVLKGWKHAEVTDYLIRTPFLYNTLFFVTMNLDKWNSLPPETQQAIEKVNQEYFEKVAMRLWDKQNEEALRFALEEQGLEEIVLSEKETARWKELVKPIQDDYAAKIDEMGLNGKEILKTVNSLAEKYNAELD